ncbi:hypothetical protein [Asanoa iriomotensis]|uniref:Uncharacterized protein n=1 Tax=Asanoa iriomotensis TaxID=234613 RepID=A0ABQ4CB48_9ACTN|nr:hypothetical protein [Asanoa iriomotensis]GIF59984.1 hypothetical protein Air01nite_60790 [Asanoa iriomotensis]
MNRNRSVARWAGRTLLALALAVGGLVVAPGAAFAIDFNFSARSLNSAKGGYGTAYFAKIGTYNATFTVCDNGPGDSRRARGEIWWASGQLNLEASSGSGTCVQRDYPIPSGQWFSMRACLRNGSVSGSLPESCGTLTQGRVP